MTNLLTFILFCTFLCNGFSAPVSDIKEDVDKRRDSTKETIELEEALKRLSGENKQFFPEQDDKLHPQADGLDTHSAENDIAHSFVSDGNPVSSFNQDDDINNDDKIAPFLSNNEPPYRQQYIDYAAPFHHGYLPDQYEEMENNFGSIYSFYDNTEYGPLGRAIEPLSQTGSQQMPSGQLQGNEYMLQNMYEILQQHPEFITKLQLGGENERDELNNARDEDEANLDELRSGFQHSEASDSTFHEESGDAVETSSLQDRLPMQATENAESLHNSRKADVDLEQLEALKDVKGDSSGSDMMANINDNVSVSDGEDTSREDTAGSGEVIGSESGIDHETASRNEEGLKVLKDTHMFKDMMHM